MLGDADHAIQLRRSSKSKRGVPTGSLPKPGILSRCQSLDRWRERSEMIPEPTVSPPVTAGPEVVPPGCLREPLRLRAAGVRLQQSPVDLPVPYGIVSLANKSRQLRELFGRKGVHGVLDFSQTHSASVAAIVSQDNYRALRNSVGVTPAMRRKTSRRRWARRKYERQKDKEEFVMRSWVTNCSGLRPVQGKADTLP